MKRKKNNVGLALFITIVLAIVNLNASVSVVATEQANEDLETQETLENNGTDNLIDNLDDNEDEDDEDTENDTEIIGEDNIEKIDMMALMLPAPSSVVVPSGYELVEVNNLTSSYNITQDSVITGTRNAGTSSTQIAVRDGVTVILEDLNITQTGGMFSPFISFYNGGTCIVKGSNSLTITGDTTRNTEAIRLISGDLYVYGDGAYAEIVASNFSVVIGNNLGNTFGTLSVKDLAVIATSARVVIGANSDGRSAINIGTIVVDNVTIYGTMNVAIGISSASAEVNVNTVETIEVKNSILVTGGIDWGNNLESIIGVYAVGGNKNEIGSIEVSNTTIETRDANVVIGASCINGVTDIDNIIVNNNTVIKPKGELLQLVYLDIGAWGEGGSIGVIDVSDTRIQTDGRLGVGAVDAANIGRILLNRTNIEPKIWGGGVIVGVGNISDYYYVEQPSLVGEVNIQNSTIMANGLGVGTATLGSDGDIGAYSEFVTPQMAIGDITIRDTTIGSDNCSVLGVGTLVSNINNNVYLGGNIKFLNTLHTVDAIGAIGWSMGGGVPTTVISHKTSFTGDIIINDGNIRVLASQDLIDQISYWNGLLEAYNDDTISQGQPEYALPLFDIPDMAAIVKKPINKFGDELDYYKVTRINTINETITELALGRTPSSYNYTATKDASESYTGIFLPPRTMTYTNATLGTNTVTFSFDDDIEETVAGNFNSIAVNNENGVPVGMSSVTLSSDRRTLVLTMTDSFDNDKDYSIVAAAGLYRDWAIGYKGSNGINIAVNSTGTVIPPIDPPKPPNPPGGGGGSGTTPSKPTVSEPEEPIITIPVEPIIPDKPIDLPENPPTEIKEPEEDVTVGPVKPNPKTGDNSGGDVTEIALLLIMLAVLSSSGLYIKKRTNKV